MCMNPIGNTFRERIRMFPSIVNCCAIDWFQPWPSDALLEVAKDKFRGIELGVRNQKEDEELLNKVIEVCPYIHHSVSKMCSKFLSQTKREVHVTPKS